MYKNDTLMMDYLANNNSVREDENLNEDFKKELEFMMVFMVHNDLTVLKNKNQLRALWTSFVIRKNLEVDTDLYDDCYIYLYSLMKAQEQNIFSLRNKHNSVVFYNWLAKDLV